MNGAVDFTQEYGFRGSDPFVAAAEALLEEPVELSPVGPVVEAVGG